MCFVLVIRSRKLQRRHFHSPRPHRYRHAHRQHRERDRSPEHLNQDTSRTQNQKIHYHRRHWFHDLLRGLGHSLFNINLPGSQEQRQYQHRQSRSQERRDQQQDQRPSHMVPSREDGFEAGRHRGRRIRPTVGELPRWISRTRVRSRS